MMLRRLALSIAVVSCLVDAAPAKKEASKPKAKPKGPVAWLVSTLGIDPKAFANLTAVRGDAAPSIGTRLVELDLRSNAEKTLWECGRCWSPAIAGSGVVVLRKEGDTTGLWLVPNGGGAPRKVVDLPTARAILGATGKPNALAVAAANARCGKSEHAVAVVDVAGGSAAIDARAPCLVPPFPARDRLMNNRILATTAERDAAGKTVPRRLIVKEPADAASPGAKRLAPFNDDVDRFDPIWRSDTTVVYVADGVGPSPAAHTMTSFFLHAWVPELGPPAEPLTEFERALLRVAALARQGRFKSADSELARLDGKAVGPRDKLLLLLFGHRTRARRYVLVGGDEMQPQFVLPFDLNKALSATTDRYGALKPQIGGDGGRAWRQFLVLDIDLELGPQLTRRFMESRASGIYSSLPDPKTQVTAARDAWRANHLETAAENLMESRDAEVLNLIADGRLASARRETAAAAALFEKALALAPAAAAVEIMLELGDAYAAPQGSPLLLGSNPSTGSYARTVLPYGVRPPSMIKIDASAIAAAQRWYDRAAGRGEGDAEMFRRIAIRRAYLHHVSGDRAAAAAELERAAAGETVTSWAASMSLGLLRNDRAAIRRAIAAAATEEFEGAIVTFSDIGQTYALASAYLAGNRREAIELLEHTADAVADSGRGRAAVEPLAVLARLYSEVGRQDAAIVAARQATELLERHLPYVERYAQGDEGAAMILAAERAQLISLKHARDTSSSVKRSDEQTGGWTGANAALVREQEALLEKNFPQAAELINATHGVNLRMLVTLKAEMDAVRAIPDCAGRMETLRHIRRRSVESGLREWVLIFDVANADCNREWLLEDRKRLESEDVLAPLLKAVREEKPSDAIGPEVRLVIRSLEALEAAEGWEALAKNAAAFAPLTDRVPGLVPYAATARRFTAVAALERGHATEALQVVTSAMEDPIWPSLTDGERMSLLAIGIEAEAALCERSACHAARALYLLELMRQAQRQAQFMRSGVAAGRKETAERAALEGRLALADTMAPADLQRLRVLRERETPDRLVAASALKLSDVEAVIRAVPDRMTVLVFYPARRHVIAWKTDRRELRLVRISNPDSTIQKLAAELQTELAAALDDGWPALAARLHSALLAPVGAIPQGHRLLVVAGGTLGTIPFEVLRGDDGKLVAQDHAVTMAESITGASTSGSGTKSLAVGLNSGPLTAAEDEARAVAKLLGGSALTGEEANATTIRRRLHDARFVHFATHATLVRENPYETYLTLANGEQLEAWRLFRDAPAARLITLSACEAGARPRALAGRAGEISESTSLVAFAFAGNADYVLASVWRADDRFAFRLMKAFYQTLAARPGDEAGALHRAKLEISKNGDVHPFYWANFVLFARSVAVAVRGDVDHMKR
jgi:CHAT domain-containing protein/tetratricopeptide (TPR) repeat protein